jgi:hypothetical protein
MRCRRDVDATPGSSRVSRSVVQPFPPLPPLPPPRPPPYNPLYLNAVVSAGGAGDCKPAVDTMLLLITKC